MAISRIASVQNAALTAAILLSSTVSYASQVRILDPDKVTLTVDAGEPFGKVVATLQTEGQGANRRLREIRLSVNGQAVPVPKEAYHDLIYPWLNTAELHREAGFDGKPWLYLFLKTGFGDATGRTPPKKVNIGFHDGRVESRFIEIPQKDSTPKRTRTDFPKTDIKSTKKSRAGNVKTERIGTVSVGAHQGFVHFGAPANDVDPYRVDVLISKPNDTPSIESRRIDVWLLARNGQVAELKRRPRTGPLIEVNSAGATANANFFFAPTFKREDLVAVVVSVDESVTAFRLR